MSITPRKLRRLFRLYFPYLGAGIRVVELRDDWRYAKVELRRTWFNPSYFGTHFGGSLYAMTDPFWVMLVLNNLGPDYVVWDKAAAIEFVKTAAGKVVARVRKQVYVRRRRPEADSGA